MQENLDNKVSEPINTVNIVNPVVQVEQQSKQSNLLTILLSVLLFVAASIASFFAYQTQVLVKELTNLKSSPSPVAQESMEPNVEAEATVDPTINWKTYTGKIFTFKYPENMSIKRQDIQDPANPNNIGDMVQLSDKLYDLQISSSFNGGWGGNPCMKIENKKIDGKDSQIIYFGKSEDETDICSNQYEGLAALVGNSMGVYPYPVIIELQPKIDGEVVEVDLFNDILSTFKIVN